MDSNVELERSEVAFGDGPDAGGGVLVAARGWQAGRPRPAIVLCPGRTGDLRGLEWLQAPLVAAGFVCLALRYRGSDAQYHLQDVADISAAVDYLQHLELVDPQRIAASGHSRGGLAVLNASFREKRLEAVAALSPPTDSISLVLGLKAYAPERYRLMMEARGGDPWDEPAFYYAISPLYHAAEIRIPVLLVHGTLDLVIPHDHSLWMHKELQRYGNDASRLELIDSAGHFFEQTSYGYKTDEVAAKVVAWFVEWLKPE